MYRLQGLRRDPRKADGVTPQYRGRFAPSPSGPLHFGSLVAAVGSFLQARSHQGVWLLRIDDVDIPRTVKGASEKILRTLERLRLFWDEEVMYQSHRTERYADALQTLTHRKATFVCACTRKDLSGHCCPVN